MSNVLIFNAKDEIRKLTSMNFTETNAVVIHVDREVADFLLSKNFDANTCKEMGCSSYSPGFLYHC